MSNNGNSFSKWRDGGVDANSNGKGTLSEITLTDNRFEKIYQGIKLKANKITFANNYCYNIKLRCIKVVDGMAHSYNNVIEDWGGSQIQFALGKKSILLSEGNIFVACGFKDINYEVNGKIEMSKNRYEKGAKANFSDKLNDDVKREIRAKNPEVKRCEDENCWKKLKDSIRKYAGAKPSSGQKKPSANKPKEIPVETPSPGSGNKPSGSKCEIVKPGSCPNNPKAWFASKKSFLDNFEKSATNKSRCKKRAKDYFKHCGFGAGKKVKAKFYSDGKLIVKKTYP